MICILNEGIMFIIIIFKIGLIVYIFVDVWGWGDWGGDLNGFW